TADVLTADQVDHKPSLSRAPFQMSCPGYRFHDCYFLFAIFSALVPGCPLNVLVGENSPSLWPTMFSVTKTGMWRLPLCTPKVSPTISGVIVERRDQVFTAGGLFPVEAIFASAF